MATKVLKIGGIRDDSFFVSLLKSFISERKSHINGNTHNIRYGEYGDYKWNGYEGYTPPTNYSNYNGYKEKEIFFYEWSDLNKEPRVFTSKNAFRLFLMKSNIPTTKELESRIDDVSALHACCRKDSKEVIFGYSKYTLENILEGRTCPYYNNYVGAQDYCWD